jgi:hypothetical protein
MTPLVVSGHRVTRAGTGASERQLVGDHARKRDAPPTWCAAGISRSLTRKQRQSYGRDATRIKGMHRGRFRFLGP